MTVTIEGELIAPADTADLERRLMGANVLPLAEREELITTTLEQSAELLSLVTRATDPAAFAKAGKSSAEMASHYAKRLDVSKDLQADATQQIRRWERMLSSSLRAGQADGTIRTKESSLIPGGPANAGSTPSVLPAAPTDYAKRGELYGAASIYALSDNVSDDEFDSALSEARAEGNVSRANVVRKIKEANGTAPAAEPKRTGDPKRAAKQVATFKRLIIRYEADEIVYGELTRAGLDPAITDTEARDIIAGIDRHIRDLNKIKKSLA